MKELEYPFDSVYLLKKYKSIKKSLLASDKQWVEKKIAVLGGSTTNHLIKMMELFLLDEGIRPVFYESSYNRFFEEAVLPNEALKTFQPDVVYIATSVHNILNWPDIDMGEKETDELLAQEYERFLMVWKSLEEKYHCVVIQNNMEQPTERLFGNTDFCDVRGKVNFVARFNDKISQYARVEESFYVFDLNYASADYGLSRWSDSNAWYLYKCACAMEAVPELAYRVTRLMKAVFGKNKKVLVLDLDNTIWGGVIGDEGPDGIELGPETALGQAFMDVQAYFHHLRQAGIVLAINSKNEYDNVLLGLSHPNSCLKKEDFAVIKANWNPKDSNMREIIRELNVLPESVVFIDDNPVEREFVKNSFEDIMIPEFDSVIDLIPIMEKTGCFEPVSISEEDRNRTKMYQENVQRVQLKKEYVDYRDYLCALKMEVEIESFKAEKLPRITQLVNKTNQYNFTSKRYEYEDIKRISEESSYLTLYGRLTDKYGDNGITSVIIGKILGDDLEIELWVMSCRVFYRDLEYAMLDELVLKCRQKGIRKIFGTYIPSKKNAMIKEEYGKLGFSQVEIKENGESVWCLSDLNHYTDQNTVIKIL